MPLSTDATRLAEILNQIAFDLQQYDEDDRKLLTKKLAQQLAPLVSAFASAVNDKKSKDEAKELLFEIGEIVGDASRLATRGEMDIFSAGVMEEYWDLKTIFQETKYRDEPL